MSILLTLICLLVSCETANYVPPVTPQMASATKQHPVDLATLREGRMLLVQRCIECHTLPVASRFTESDWPCIVHEMGGRANLKPAERDAVLAYIIAVHSQSR